jgi:ABC-2 type transport system permease protein
MKTYSWLVRREFWENRAIWMIPAAIGALLIIAALFGRVDVAVFDSPIAARNIGGMFLVAIGALFYVVMSSYSSWYLMDCLYSDRRDRSILFWKSLPVSDTQTVLSKLAVALLAIPLVYLIGSNVTSLIMAFILSVRAHSALGGALWHLGPWLHIQVLWLYVVMTSAIWYLPVVGWLMLVSAWAKRAVMLWSLVPLFLLLIEKWLLNTQVVQRVVGPRLSLVHYASIAFHGNDRWIRENLSNDTATAAISVWHFINPSEFFSQVEVWIGLAVGIAMIVGAIQLRMRRTEI